MPDALEHRALHGARVSLEPLGLEHVAQLFIAAQLVGHEGNLTEVPDSAEATSAYVCRALADQAQGHALPFVIRDRETDELVGTTRFSSVSYWYPDAKLPQSLEIGNTWLAREARRTPINTECKYLLLKRAFEELAVDRVSFQTDARNDRSRRALLRIGAMFEGTLRSHRLGYDGAIRDTAMFSIVKSDWLRVRERLKLLIDHRHVLVQAQAGTGA